MPPPPPPRPPSTLLQALLRTLSGHIEFVNLNVDDLMASLATSSLEDLDAWRVGSNTQPWCLHTTRRRPW